MNYCNCPVPDLHFELPNGDGVIHEDERVTINMPSIIDSYALDRVRELVAAEIGCYLYNPKLDFIYDVEPVWETRRGNYTKRLGAAAAKSGFKLSSGVLTKVGNIVRGYDTSSTYNIEISRDFNQPQEYWAEWSCWWTFATESRCRMKSWGGFGIRCFADEQSTKSVGRMWVVALDANFQPTFDSLHAPIYVIFNPKQYLSNPTHARLMSQLTGRPYKNIYFTHDVIATGDLWKGLKSDGGTYIVADQKTCDATESLCLDYDFHTKGIERVAA